MLEPMTALTDLLLCIVACMLGLKLMEYELGEGLLSRFFWGKALLSIGFSAFLGVINHGFISADQPHAKFFFWRVTMIAIGSAGSNFMLSAVIVLGGKARHYLVIPLCVLDTIYIVWIWFFYDFRVVIVWLALALVALGMLCCKPGPHRKSLVVGAVLTGIGLGLWSASVALNSYINHNDLYHLIQLVAVFFLYRAGLQLKDCADA